MNRIIAFLLIIVFASCGRNLLKDLLTDGEVDSSGFYVTVPFEYKEKEIFIEAIINGQKGLFLLDTGAPNLITSNFQKQLGIKAITNQSIRDSRSRKATQSFTRLNEVEIGGIKFKNTGAVIADFNKSPEIQCLGIDGLIGSNLMRQAFWQIDYQKEVLIITDQSEKLNIGDQPIKLSFEPSLQGTPKIKLTGSNQLKTKIKLDTGSGGELTLNSRYIRKIEGKRRYKYGYTSSGLYGSDIDTTVLVKGKEIWLDATRFQNNRLKGDKKSSNLIGNQFLEDYLVTIDWKQQLIYLNLLTNLEDKVKRNYGISVRHDQEQLIVSSIIKDSPADLLGIKLKDQVIAINDKEWANLAFDDYCSIKMDVGFLPKEGPLKMKIKRNVSNEIILLELKDKFGLFVE